jgi:hypothetical protein
VLTHFTAVAKVPLGFFATGNSAEAGVEIEVELD